MTKIDIIKIVGTLISTILIPVILEWLKRRSENRMFSNEQLKLNLENAKEFKDIVLSTWTYPQPYPQEGPVGLRPASLRSAPFQALHGAPQEPQAGAELKESKLLVRSG